MHAVDSVANALDRSKQLRGLLLKTGLSGKCLGGMNAESSEVGRYFVRPLLHLLGLILRNLHLGLDASPYTPPSAGEHHHEANHRHNLGAAHGLTPQSRASLEFSARICRLVPSVILSSTDGRTGRAMSQ